MRQIKLAKVGVEVYGLFSGKFVKYNAKMKKIFASLKAMPLATRNAKIDTILAKILCIKPKLTGDAKVLVQFLEDNLVMMR
jgi:hypothetical protein